MSAMTISWHPKLVRTVLCGSLATIVVNAAAEQEPSGPAWLRWLKRLCPNSMESSSYSENAEVVNPPTWTSVWEHFKWEKLKLLTRQDLEKFPLDVQQRIVEHNFGSAYIEEVPRYLLPIHQDLSRKHIIEERGSFFKQMNEDGGIEPEDFPFKADFLSTLSVKVTIGSTKTYRAIRVAEKKWVTTHVPSIGEPEYSVHLEEIGGIMRFQTRSHGYEAIPGRDMQDREVEYEFSHDHLAAAKFYLEKLANGVFTLDANDISSTPVLRTMTRLKMREKVVKLTQDNKWKELGALYEKWSKDWEKAMAGLRYDPDDDVRQKHLDGIFREEDYQYK